MSDKKQTYRNSKEQTDNQEEHSKYDSAWKTIIKKLFKDFLLFFFPVIHDAIDFTRGVTFLDHELQEIYPDSVMGDRDADVLVKVHLKDNNIKYIALYIHIEVQGQPRPNFMERIFIYFYRAIDIRKDHDIPVISLAILTDDNPKYRPDEYSFSLVGFELKMKIPIIKILDYKNNEEMKKKLETTDNPMAMIVKAQLKSFEVKGSDNDKKFEVTKELIRQCYKNGYSDKETKIIMHFFDWVIRLPEFFKDKIKQVIKQVEEEFKMEYVPIWLRDEREEGIKIGEKRGEKRGVEIGIEVGEKRGEINGEKRGKIKTARNMLKKGFEIDVIVEVTGLTKKEVKNLLV
jgi:predicted transposase/invertase (TIGR01784 family)